MKSYQMCRLTLIAPAVRNDGQRSHYANAVRAALREQGVDGWTEYTTVGVWRGAAEPGTLFEFYRAGSRSELGWFARELGTVGRTAMPDQAAVQVTLDPQPVTVWEA